MHTLIMSGHGLQHHSFPGRDPKGQCGYTGKTAHLGAYLPVPMGCGFPTPVQYVLCMYILHLGKP